QDDEMRQELDDDFAAVRALLFDGDESSKPMMKAADGDGNDLDVSYDAAVRELIFEQRARPQDRLKTEDEVIREEKEKLERAERHRQRRMDGLPSDSEPESDDDEGALKKGYDAQSKRAPEADDLGDDFAAADSDEEDNDAGAAGIQLGAGLGADESEDEEDSEEGSDEEEDSGSEDDDEGTDLGDSDSEAEPVSKKAIRPTKTAKVSAASKTTDDALPFTFPAPADYDQWLEIIGDYTLDQQLVVIKRLRTLYHIRLSPQNKEKLSNLCVVLLEHFAVLAEQDPPVPMPVIDEISKHIGELISIDVDRIGEHCRQTVIEIHMRIAAAIKGASGTTEKHMAAPAAMRPSDVALMRLFVSLFSSSDRYNSVITPLLVTMCQFLSQYTFTELNDFTAGLILVGIIHETQRLSRRFVPETLNFLFATLSACVCDPANAKDWHGQFPLSRRQREAYGSLRISEKSATVAPVTWAWLFDTSDEAEISAAQKLGILRSCLVLARKYIDVYFSTPAFIELFTPLQSILAQISDRAGSKMAPKEIVELTGEVASYLDSQLEQAHASRTPLKMQYHKPLAIQSIAPKFESNYSIDAHYDPNHDRNEILKLRRQVNKEKRGAVRELRRDAQFIQAERLKEMREKDKTYADKMKKAWGVLENDQSEMKKLDKLRIKERKAKIE
ncbi:nucleolar complex protein 14, partial [Linderina macrospora]